MKNYHSKGENAMAKTREEPCVSYVCQGECERGREADHHGYCQRCRLYKPRAKRKHLNLKKFKLNKLRKNERF